MKVVIFGATGGTGRELLKQALAAGDEVTAFARDPSNLVLTPRLHVASGDALDAVAVGKAISGQSAVISALGPRSLNDNVLLSRSMTHILAGMNEHGVRRLIVLGAAGTMPQTERRLGPARRALLRFAKATLLHKILESQAAMQAMVRASGLDWTIVQPPRLLNSPGKGRYRVDGEALPASGGVLPRTDLAMFMLAQLASAEWVRRDVYVAS